MSDNQIAFVAQRQIPPSPPPASETGVIGWLRENMFAGPVNSVISILAGVFVLWLVDNIVAWSFLNSTWSATSLAGCREAWAAFGPESGYAPVTGKVLNGLMGLFTEVEEVKPHRGACWAVIVERFDQFIYGFYPHEERWRPNLAFILLLVALVPALFDNVPYRGYGLMFSASYPIIAYWLLWGGSFWGIVAFIMAFVLAYNVFLLCSKYLGKEGAAIGLVAGLAAAVFWLVFGLDRVADQFHAVLPLGLEPVASNKMGGFLLASIIGVAGIVLSLPIGILLALGRRSGMIFIQTVCIVFIEFIRGVPLITLLFVANVVLNYFFPPGTAADIILRVVIMVTLFASAYMAEVIRGGLAALPQGQYEAADSLGLDYWKSMRLIIMPQALKISIPNIVSSFIGLFKDTTLVVVIGLLDPVGLIGTTRADSAWNGIIWEFYVFVGLFFFVVCFGMSRYSMYLERKLKTDR